MRRVRYLLNTMHSENILLRVPGAASLDTIDLSTRLGFYTKWIPGYFSFLDGWMSHKAAPQLLVFVRQSVSLTVVRPSVPPSILQWGCQVELEVLELYCTLFLVVNSIPPSLYFVQINLIKKELAEIPT